MADVKVELRKLAETTSVRGIPRAVKAKDNAIRTLWLIAVVCCTSILLWQVITVVQEYLSYRVSTVIVEDESITPKFPDVTICNINALNMIDLNKYNRYLANIRDKRTVWSCQALRDQTGKNFSDALCDLVWKELALPAGYLTSLDLASNAAARATSDKLPKLLVDIKWYGSDWHQIVSLPDVTTKVWQPHYHPCYTLQLPDASLYTVMGFEAVIYLNNFADSLVSLVDHTMTNGVRVTVHSRGSKPNVKTAGIDVGRGTDTTISLSATQRFRLSKPWGKCNNEPFIVPEENLTYTTSVCNDFCKQNKVITACGCVSRDYAYSWKMLQSVNHTICGNQTLATQSFHPPGVTSVTGTDVDEIRGVTGLLCSWLAVEKSGCGTCHQPCSEWIYSTAVSATRPWPDIIYQKTFYDEYISKEPYASQFADYFAVIGGVENGTLSESEAIKKFQSMNAIDRNYLQLSVMFTSNVVYVVTDTPTLTIDSLFGSLGGVLSLWLGINVMTLVELFEFCVVVTRERWLVGRKVRSEDDVR